MVSERKAARVQVRLSVDLRQRLEEAAQARGCNLSEAVRAALDGHLAGGRV